MGDGRIKNEATVKVKKWVELSEEVEVQIDINDIRSALAEALQVIVDSDEWASRYDVKRALNSISEFFDALTDEQIDLLEEKPRQMVHAYLAKAADRFAPKGMK